MNDENLKPLNTRTPEERKEIAAKGGQASGIAKREKKIMSEALAKYFGHKSLEEHFDAIMERNDHVTLGLIKEAREALEGQKININDITEGRMLLVDYMTKEDIQNVAEQIDITGKKKD